MSERQYAMPHDLPVAITPLGGTELAMFEQGGQLVQAPYSALTGDVAEHAEKHQIDGEDPIGTLDNIDGGIPYLDTNGMLDSRVSDASTTTKGKVQLAADGEEDATKAVNGTDSRLSDARAPTAHASQHIAGDDVIPDATVSNAGLMSAEDKVKADATFPEYIPTADQKAALAGSYGTPSDTNRFITETDPIISGGGGGAGIDLLGIGEIGTGLSISGVGTPALASLNSTDVAFIDAENKELRTYRFNETTWSLVGTGLSVSSGYTQALASLNSTDVAFIDNENEELRTYRFNGTTWSQVGTGLSITDVYFPALAALNSTDVAFIDINNKELRTYRFNGTSWSLVGTGLSISAIGTPSLAALNSTDVAFIDNGNDELRTYRFNGTTWSQKGTGLSISSIGVPALAALNSTDVAFIDSTNDELWTYRFNGTSWSLVGAGLSISVNYHALAALNSTDVAFIDSINDELRTYNFLFGYDSASVNISADYTVPELATGKSLIVRRTSAYDGNPVTITPPSGATFEGLASYELFEQYASVTIERISSTMFVVADESVQSFREVGTIKAYAGTTAPPGFFICDGTAKSRTMYSALFDKIGTAFGVGDGSTTFNLPDARESVLVGTGTRGTGVTAHDTYTLGQFKDDQMQGHKMSTASVGGYGFSGHYAIASGNVYSVPVLAGADDELVMNTIITDTVNGTPRTGSTTHGKQLGINYIIRYA